MQNNYVKNKLLFNLSACVILLGLTNSSALAQQKYPTEAQIQQAKVNLRQEVQSVKNRGLGNYIEDRRTPEEIQNREKFVSAWQQIEPGIAPFLGSWVDYEGGWSIYPSIVKHRVCVEAATEGGSELYVGKINNGNIHLSSGSVIFPEGKYLGVTSLQNQQEHEGPLNNPTVPREPSISDKYVDETFDPSSFLQAYKQAGCTASLPSKSNTMTWQELKTFVEQKKVSNLEGMFPDQFPNQFANGKIAITALHTGRFGYVVAKEGVNFPYLSNVKELSQTDGSFNAVNLENAVEFPLPALNDEDTSTSSLYNSSQLIVINNWAARYDSEGLRSDARKSEQTTLPNGKKAYYLEQGWCSFSDESAEYSDYLCVSIANSPKTSLEVLKSILASRSEPKTVEINMPDSLKLTLEHKGSNTETEFIKGDDGYYNWFVKKEGFLASLTNSFFNSLTNNTSGTCLGLKENKDLAKVRLTTYPCNSQEGARKWEILMVNDNTGYKIKLPNTKYCLGADIGVLDCDSPDAPVENLTPEQLEEFIAINPNLNYRRDSSTTTVAKTFEDVTAFGVRQFLKADYSLQPAYDRLVNAAKDQYDLVEVPDDHSIAKSFATIQPMECRGEWGCRSKAVEVSYSDYLKLKLKLKTQSDIIQKIFEEQGTYEQIKYYQEKLGKSKQQQAKEVNQNINSNFEKYRKFAEDTSKDPSLWEKLKSKKQWTYIGEELKYSVPNFIVSSAKTGGKAALSIPAISTLIDTLTIPEDLVKFLKQGKKSVETVRYIQISAEKIGDMKNALVAGNFDEMRQINLDMAQETIELIDSDQSLKQLSEVKSAYSSAKALIEREEMMKKLEPLNILNLEDKNYFYASQAADAVDFTASVISAIYPESLRETVPQKYKKYFNVLEVAKPVKDLLYESLANSYKDSFILNYVSTETMTSRNQKIIKELHSWIDSSGASVGDYLLQNYGESTVGLAGDGKNVYVTKDNIFYPPN